MVSQPSNGEFKLPARTEVVIKRNDPYESRTTIYVTPANGFVAKKLEVPSKQFLAACQALAEEMEAELKALEGEGEPVTATADAAG